MPRMRPYSVAKAFPPPIKGWNTRDALADMPEDCAIILENWFPGTDKVRLRGGSAEHATGLSSSVESLLPYTPPSGSAELFGCAGENIFDVTAAGAVGAAVATGFTSSRFQSVQIGNAGGHFLFACNGNDTPQVYDGSSWADTTLTGPTVDNIIWCQLHQRRLFIGEKNSLVFWYGDVNAITGAFNSFSLAGIPHLGGYIMAMGTWSRDSGTGMDDIAVFFTSEGQAIVYQGTNPASDWSLIGVFTIGKPIGRRCMIKAGADLVMTTQDGFVAASTILSMDRSQAGKVALSDQINKAVNDAVRLYSGVDGWEPFLYPRGTMLLFNIPTSSTVSQQFVFNTLTQAPCKFTGLNARCWALLNDKPYFGTSDGRVMEFDTDTSDDGLDINADALQAFSYFNSPQSRKAFKLVEPVFESDGDPNAAIDLCVDYRIQAPTGVAQSIPVQGGLWDVAEWDVGLWGGDDQIYRRWRGVRGFGRAAAIRIRVKTSAVRPSWIATNWSYVPGVPGHL